MSHAFDQELAAATSPNMTANHQESSSARRRKVRKGTRSCWECKRRKIRCIFASPEHVTCIGCQRRRAPCVSQDMPEDLSPATIGNRHLSDRIAKVEDLMRVILASKDIGKRGQIETDSNTRQALSNYAAPPSIRAPPTPGETLAESVPDLLFTPKPRNASYAIYAETALHHLLAAFPSDQDAAILLRESSRTSLYTHLVNTQPHSKMTLETLSSPYSVPRLPDSNIHPVTLARCIVMFAITLQSPCGQRVQGLSEPQSVLMHRLMAAATTWVTTKEEMHGTVDCLVCIIFEGVFEVNSGNLRRAWSVYRRAITVAQLMGLHRSPIPPQKRIDPTLDADVGFLWFRVVYMDRYLSLLLGLPQGTTDTSMGVPSALQDEPPLGKFERQLTVIASRVLERNERVFSSAEMATTQSIDSELLSVSKSMPAGFWRPPNFHNLTPGSPETLLETVRLAAHVYYYGMLIQLHLPYMIKIASNTGHEYSKMACVNASREIMTRFIAHRSFNPMSSCSRPVDFFALLAAMTLLLAHLDVHNNLRATQFLAHQRLSDRAMLDQAMERMDAISNVSKDAISEKSAKLIRRLLEIEADAAEGNKYIASNVRDEGVQGGQEEDGMQLQIPYLGVIKIARQRPTSQEAVSPQTSAVNFLQRLPAAASPSHCQTLSHVSDSTQGSTPSGNLSVSGLEYEQSMLQYTDADEWAFQGVDMAFFDTLMRATPCDDIEQSER